MSQNEVISKKRTAVLLLLVIAIIGGLIFRVTYLQVFLSGWLRKSAESQRFRAVPVLPRRGTIYDRLGNELAISIDRDCIYAIPNEVVNPVRTAAILGRVLAMDSHRLERLLTKRASFVWIKRNAMYDEIQHLRKTIKDEKLTGIEISQKAQRFYPQSSLGAQALGIAGIDNQGLEGLEREYDFYLKGVPGSDQAEFDTSGRHIPQGERRYLEPVHGDSLYLTIDENIQYIVERELDKAVADTNSKRGMAILVDPQTGEILAEASSPKYDPNHFSDFPSQNRRNPLFTDMYEPGSTFKVFTTVAALEEGKVTLDSTFFDPGFIVVDDRRIKCWRSGGHGSQNFVQALENSCNPVFASLALRLGKDTFYKYIKEFGFGRETGVDFPGESSGRLQSLAKVKNVELANIGFGQGLSVTPIQMVMGISAIANGGYLLKPQLVKEIIGPDGKVKKKFKREVVSQVISAKSAALVANLLQSVVTNGSGNRAYLEGYRVAGKTGTAQKVGPGGVYNKLMASFIGFAPAENTRAVCLVILDEPGCPITYGGVIAAPVVGNIFRDTLRYLGVKPKYEPEVLEKISKDEVIVPNVLNMPTEEAIAVLKSKQIEYRLVGKGSYIFDQVPKSGVKINRNTKVLLYFDPEEQYGGSHGSMIILPDFTGLSLRKADQLLTDMGLKLEAKGDGVAVAQEPSPGSTVDYGSKVKVIFKPSINKP